MDSQQAASFWLAGPENPSAKPGSSSLSVGELLELLGDVLLGLEAAWLAPTSPNWPITRESPFHQMWSFIANPTFGWP